MTRTLTLYSPPVLTPSTEQHVAKAMSRAQAALLASHELLCARLDETTIQVPSRTSSAVYTVTRVGMAWSGCTCLAAQHDHLCWHRAFVAILAYADWIAGVAEMLAKVPPESLLPAIKCWLYAPIQQTLEGRAA